MPTEMERIEPLAGTKLKNAGASPLLISVHADRSTEYEWKQLVTDGFSPELRLVPCGESEPIPDDINLARALWELFEVFTLQRHWLSRELAFARDEDLDPRQRVWARRILKIRRGMTAELPDNDAKYTAWMKRHSKKDKRGRACKKFADSWADFAADFGPLSDKLDSKTFGSCASDLRALIQEASGLRAEVDDQELRAEGDAKVARARAAAAKVTGKSERVSPDLFSALAYAIEHGKVRYRICRIPSCERLFVMATEQKKWCSGACRKKAQRRRHG